METGIIIDVKKTLQTKYRLAITNYFGDEKQALKFLSGVIDAIQRNPKLQECTPDSLINSFMIMAQLEFMPSVISGEAYVLPYKIKNVMTAQFQLGYQGIITLLYKAGAKSVVAELVRRNDYFKIVNGSISHKVDPFKTKSERGEAIGAYAIITNQSGGKVERFMRGEEIQDFGKRFSKSFGTDSSPWEPSNDPEGWMWRKTVLKQAAKLAPKNEQINMAIAYDNEDSVMSDRIKEAKDLSKGMTMGALAEGENKNNDNQNAEETKT